MLNNLALLYKNQGRLSEAEPLYLRSLASVETTLGPEHLDVATSLNNLAGLYFVQGRHQEAEALCRRSAAILKAKPGDEHPEMSTALSNLGTLLVDLGRYEDGEQLLRRSLELRERQLGPHHLSVATKSQQSGWSVSEAWKVRGGRAVVLAGLNDLGSESGSKSPRRCSRSEQPWGSSSTSRLAMPRLNVFFNGHSAFERNALGPFAPSRGRVSQQSGCSVSGTKALQRSRSECTANRLAICEKAFGPKHPEVATRLSNLAELYRLEGQAINSEPLYRRALDIRESALGADHPDTANSLDSLGGNYFDQTQVSGCGAPFSQSANDSRKVAGCRTSRRCKEPEEPGGCLLCPEAIRRS